MTPNFFFKLICFYHIFENYCLIPPSQTDVDLFLLRILHFLIFCSKLYRFLIFFYLKNQYFYTSKIGELKNFPKSLLFSTKKKKNNKLHLKSRRSESPQETTNEYFSKNPEAPSFFSPPGADITLLHSYFLSIFHKENIFS